MLVFPVLLLCVLTVVFIQRKSLKQNLSKFLKNKNSPFSALFRQQQGDITCGDFTQRIEELEKKNAFFIEILNRIANPVFVKDRDHRWVYMNDAHSAFMGKPTAEMIGKSDFDFFPEYQARIFREKDELVFTTGKDNINEEEFTDSQGQTHIIQTKKTLYTDQDNNKFIVGVFTDITERIRNEDNIHRLNTELELRVAERTAQLTKANDLLKQDNLRRMETEKALEQQKERLSVTLRSIGDGVIAVDTRAKIILMNKAAEELTGWSALETKGLDFDSVFTLVEAKTHIPYLAPVSQVLENSGTGVPIENIILVSKHKQEKLISLSCAPIRDRNSLTVGAVLAFRDITEKKHMEQMLLNSQKLESLGVLAGGIAHDFNNLLTGIFGFLTLAREEIDSQSKAAEYLENAINVWNRAKALTKQFVTFSKGGQPQKKIESLKQTLTDNAKFMLSGKNVDCRFDIQDDLRMCNIDINQFSQVIDNIIINAQQAMTGGGSIFISAENLFVAEPNSMDLKGGEYIRIRIRDQGPGISEENLAHIFDPFFTTKDSGSGLGLASAHSIIKKHDGYLGVESVPGEGCTFSIYLPAADNENNSLTETINLQAQGSALNHRRILVMDDEDFILALAEKLLIRMGYRVSLVTNGNEALDRYTQAFHSDDPFDLVILDLTIPGGLNGKETIRLLREFDPNVKAIASSGYFDDPVISEPEKYGFIGTLPKPYTHFELNQILRNKLGF